MNISEEAQNILRGIPVDILEIPNRAKNVLSADGVENALRAIDLTRERVRQVEAWMPQTRDQQF